MKWDRSSARWLIGVLAVAIGGSLVGCGGDDGIGRRYPVFGSVTYNGQPVANGRISFTPAKGGEGRTAAGEIRDGRYTLTTVTADDEALAGSYRVSLMAREVNLTQVKANQKGGSAAQRRDQGEQDGEEPDPRQVRLARDLRQDCQGQRTIQHDRL